MRSATDDGTTNRVPSGPTVAPKTSDPLTGTQDPRGR